MAVLVEAISVIVKREAIVRIYRGGWQEFMKHVPNKTFCADDELVRVGFMHPKDVEAYVVHLVERGLTFLDESERAIDIAVADQQQGLTSECDWLEFGKVNLKDPGGKVAACWCFDRPRVAAGVHLSETSFPLATPAGWTFEHSLSRQFAFVPTKRNKERFRFLRREGDIDVYLDKKTGKEVWQSRSAGPDL